MCKKLSARFFVDKLKATAAGKLLLFLCLFSITKADGQSYYYIESTLSSGEKSPVQYFALLVVDGDGTATARIVYKNPGTDEQKLVEQKFIDSAETPGTDDTRKYLYPQGAPVYKNSVNDSSFIQPRFVFQKQVEGTTIFYTLVATDGKTADGWKAGELTLGQEKSYADLAGQKDFVGLFFNPADELYKFFLDYESRGGGLNPEEQKTRLFLIAVADTLDLTIGTTSAIDLAKITELFTTMAGKLGIQLLQKNIAGKGFGKRYVDNAIDRWLTPAANDIVIFYYTGHGFRYPNDVSNYPRMDLRIKDDIDANNLSVESVYNRILRKKARVSIVISDCCNDELKKTSPVGRPLLKTRSTGTADLNLNMANCRALFFPGRQVSLLATSAQKNQLAVGNPQLGGFFTNFLQANLVKTIYGNEANPSWYSIINQTRENTSRQSLSALCNAARCVQTAVSNVTPLQ